MSGYRRRFIGAEPGRRYWLFAHQNIGQLLQNGFLCFTRVATESRLDGIEIFHQQIAESRARGKDRVSRDHIFLADHVRLSVGLLLRLDQFVCLVQAWVLDVMFAQRDVGNTKEAKLHAGGS